MKPLLLSLTLLLSGCTFLAFPVAPEPVQVALPVLPRTAGLKLQDQNLQITVQIPGGEGYVGVIWYQASCSSAKTCACRSVSETAP